MKLKTAFSQIFEALIHLLGWSLAVLALNSLLAVRAEEVLVQNGVEQTIIHTQSLLPYILVSLAVKAVLVYGCTLWIFPVYIKKQKIAIGLSLALLLFAAVALLEYWGYTRINAAAGFIGEKTTRVLDEHLRELTVNREALQETPYSFWNMALYVLAVAVAFAWFLVRDWNAQEKQLRELRELQTGTELNFLKLQINPHFLFNTLNNLFSVAQKNNDEETASGIAKLADLMRYLLNESSKALIPLEQELHYIHSYIELAKMRFSNDELDVVFDLHGAVENRFVPPMLLIPFVENAFKHGVRVGEYSRIVFTLNLGDKRLDFSGNNPDHAAANFSEARHHGIGLENVRKRISLLYPSDGEMTYGSQNGTFRFQLRLPV